jgi:hypothetical protein
MLRKVLIGLVIGLILVTGAGVYLYHKFAATMRRVEEQVAAQRKLLAPRVMTGRGNFERRTFYTGDGLGNISQILAGWPADREGADIAVVGNQGTDFVDATGHVKKRVRLSIESRVPIKVARVDRAGNYGYLTRDQSWAVPVTLFDKDGHVLWRSGDQWPGVDDSISGEFNGDGEMFVVVGLNGSGGLILLNGHGKQVWKKAEDNVWQVEALNTNGDGHDEIVHSNAKGQLLVRNGNGDILAHYLPDFYVSNFALVRWGGETQATHILAPVSKPEGECCKPKIVILDSHGEKLTELDNPLGGLFSRFSATPVQFQEGAVYFALLENDSSAERSKLMLYGQDGQIAYQEILGESCLGMAAYPTKKTEKLLVGCADRIWEYSPVSRDPRK